VEYEAQNIVFFRPSKAENSLEIMQPFTEGVNVLKRISTSVSMSRARRTTGCSLMPRGKQSSKFGISRIALGNYFCD